jgi:hypothetical protein
MKKSVNLLKTILLFTLFNCNPDTEIPAPNIEFEKQIKFFATVSLWNQPTILNPEYSKEKAKTHYETQGRSDSKNLYNYQLNMSHFAMLIEFGKSIHVQDGKFEMLGNDGHSIFGTYEGYGDLSHESIGLDLLLTVKGGTGFYSNAKGFLEMKTQVYEPHSSALFFEVEGYIIRETE